jgi:hypothetical protein
MTGGKEHFLASLEGRRSLRPAFIPLLSGLVATVSDTPYHEMVSDPTVWSNGLMKTADLFDVDGVVVGCDFKLLAEAYGSKIDWQTKPPRLTAIPDLIEAPPATGGKMEHVIESARRVNQMCRDTKASIAALTGPLTLASQLFGRQADSSRLREVKDLLVKEVEAFCDTRPDAILLMEGRALANCRIGLAQRRIFKTIKNIAGYFNIPLGLYLQGYDVGGPSSELASLEMDFYIFGAGAQNTLPPLSMLLALTETGSCFGLGLPLDNIEGVGKAIKEVYEACAKRNLYNFFTTSIGFLDAGVAIDQLLNLRHEIDQISI